MKSYFFIFLLSLTIIQSTFAQWEPIDDLVGGGIINDIIEYQDNIFISTLDNGIFRSEDNGITWISYNLEQSSILPNMITHKSSLYSASFGYLLVTEDGLIWSASAVPGISISHLASNGTNIYAATLNHGVYYSDSDGDSWEDISNGQTDLYIESLVAYDNWVFAGGVNGKIFKTGNDGVTWQLLQLDTEFTISKLAVNNNGILLANANEKLFLSEDDGVTWDVISDEGGIYDFFIEGNSIMMHAGQNLFSSDNLGESWVNLGAISPQYNGSSVYFNDENVLIGTWGGGVLKNNRQASDSWVQSNQGLTISVINEIAYNNDQLVVGTEQNFVQSSIDEGENWVNEYNSNGFYGGNARALLFSENYLIIGQGGGGIHRRKQDSNEWENSNNGLESLNIVDLSSDDDHIYAATDDGVFRSDDEGLNWVESTEGITSGLRCLWSDNNYILAGTWNGLFISDDQGDTWNSINGDLPGTSINDVVFVENTIIVATQFDGVYKSSNMGTSWDLILDDSRQYLTHYDKYVFAGTFEGSIQLTSDFGSSWTNVDNGDLPNALINSIGFSDKFIYAGMKQPGSGLFKRHLHEIMPPLLSFQAGANAEPSFRLDEKLYIHANMSLYNAESEPLQSSMLSGLITILNSEEAEVEFEAILIEETNTIEIALNAPIVGEEYRIIVSPVKNESDLINEESTSPSFLYKENNQPELSDIFISGIINSDGIELSVDEFANAFSDADDDLPVHIKITSLPTQGILKMNDVEVLNESIWEISQIENFIYVPEQDFLGTVSIGWNAFDGFEYAQADASVEIQVVVILSVDNNENFTSANLYPNPTSNNLSISIEDAYLGLIQVRLFNNLGELVYSTSFEKESKKFHNQIDLSQIPEGIFYIFISEANNQIVRRIIKR